MQLELPKRIRLCAQEKLAILLATTRKNDALRVRTSRLLISLDRHAEALEELLTIDAAAQNGRTWLEIARCRRASDQEEDRVLARQALDRALTYDLDLVTRTDILVEQGDLAIDMGESEVARTRLVEALAINPASSIALRKLAALELDCGRAKDLLEHCEALLAAGHRHSRLLSTTAIALARLGRLEDAKRICDVESSVLMATLALPADAVSLEQFNTQLARELRESPALRFDNSQSANVKSWRVEELVTRNSRLTPLLFECIARQVSAAVAKMSQKADKEHGDWTFGPKPARAQLSAWSVIGGGESYQNWHMHGAGWVSGVYYVQIPKALTHGKRSRKSRAGTINFGWSDRLLGPDLAGQLPELCLQPTAGTLLLFPSHLHHRTWAHGQDGDRIVISFDIVPK